MFKIKDFSFIDSTTIYCHPDNISLIKEKVDILKDPNITYIKPFNIVGDKNIPKFKEKWIPPVERFIEYEQKDEYWAKPLGIGKVIKEPIFYASRLPTVFKL